MSLIIDLLVYGIPFAIGLGLLKYYGGEPEKNRKYKDETDQTD